MGITGGKTSHRCVKGQRHEGYKRREHNVQKRPSGRCGRALTTYLAPLGHFSDLEDLTLEKGVAAQYPTSAGMFSSM